MSDVERSKRRKRLSGGSQSGSESVLNNGEEKENEPTKGSDVESVESKGPESTVDEQSVKAEPMDVDSPVQCMTPDVPGAESSVNSDGVDIKRDLDSDDSASEFHGFDHVKNRYKAFSSVFKAYETGTESDSSSTFSPKGLLETGETIIHGIFSPSVRHDGKTAASKFDISKPEFRKPFDFGWRRELVFRSTNESSLKRSADVYYYTPSNKKLRSSREVLEHLVPGEGLTIDNFTFFKEALGVSDPAKEIIRDAKIKTPRSTEDGFYTLPMKSMSPVNKLKEDKKKSPVKSSLVTSSLSSPPDKSSASGNSSDTSLPGKSFDTPPPRKSPISTSLRKTALTASLKKSSVISSPGSPLINKIVITAKKATPKSNKKKSFKSSDLDDYPLDREWNVRPKTELKEVCSIECRLAMGIIPTVQCLKCLCLYHPECVNLSPRGRTVTSYICKYCVNTKKASPNLPPPPPLTPIIIPPKKDITKAVIIIPPAKKEVQKKEVQKKEIQMKEVQKKEVFQKKEFQKIEVVQKKEIQKSEVLQKKEVQKKEVKTATTTCNSVTSATNQTIVGAVTTWLPATSSIQVGKVPSIIPQKPEVEAAPQIPVSIQGKKFLVIPKQNIVKLDGGGEGTEEVAEAPATQVQNNAGVYLVPYTLSSPSGTYVVQMPSSAPTYIIASSNIPSSNPSTTSASIPNDLKRGASDAGKDGPPAKVAVGSKSQRKDNDTVKTHGTSIVHPPDHFMSSINAGYLALLQAFQYLKVHELLRAACVCRMWRHIATHRSLWRTVKMKNSRVRDWEGFANSLQANNTAVLDLKKMLVPEGKEALGNTWCGLVSALSSISTLRKIDVCRCDPDNLESIAEMCPQLDSIIALSIKGDKLDLGIFKSERLIELKLKSLGGSELSNFEALKHLTNLKHLALTSFKKIRVIDWLPDTLESLEVGECCFLNESFATEILPRLTKLKRLRLEKGQGNVCPTLQIINTVSQLANLSQLELINFDIKPGFDKALSKCVHIRTFLIIPTYVTQSATTNHLVMNGVTELSSTLTCFVWGLTLELLRVTDLFIDQVDGGRNKKQTPKKGVGDSIPILKPLSDGSAELDGQTSSQVDILALPKLQKVLSGLLPTTKIKILKIPFSATWRQVIN